MAWFLCPALEQLRKQINAANPGRDKTSDGSVGDTSHKARKSDHNPGPESEVKAIDVDEDLSPTIHSAESLVKALQASGDSRIKYIIYERRITVEGDITRWKAYKGPSPHDHHFHISVKKEKKYWNDGRVWDLTKTLTNPAPVQAAPVIYNLGDRGPAVKKIQDKLVVLGLLTSADGDFGPKTLMAVKAFQKSKGLVSDGSVGIKTKEALGL